ncbi:glycosyltransferase family 2 protein [Microbulbifer agarilyticus]|uniref:glycosyltransferase family 2 protein n=1 Tax=Microbulbifer agarilyticus TaxID=260552 RepID=UPI001C973FC0|nr:glycosyltransferase family 2 protein [Microbulbifer agarilyticus]MBY6190515.1 glycosyltransferase family 2 protein [Microbulbifer agarilyticus]
MSRLRPAGDVKAADGGEGYQWRSMGIDPQFQLARGRFPAGWYMLEVQLEYERSDGDACLYVDSGNGYSESEKYSLPLRAGKISKRLVYLPKAARAVRFDPLESSGLFSVNHLRLVRLASWFARDRLLQRLTNMHIRYREMNRGEVLAEIKRQASDAGQEWLQFAWARYCETFERRRHGRDYHEWIEEVECSRRSTLEGSKATGPLFSIILPTYNSDVRLLRECIESVFAQSYQNWQLCIADDASPNADVKQFLRETADKDARVKVTFREENGHISAASNSALSLADGDYLVFLDHDDALVPSALARVHEALVRNPDARLIYSDEDKINERGERFDPHFKPAWNPDLLLSQNYICHLMVLKAGLVRQIAGFREGLEGSQDHDLLLRCLPHLSRNTVVHIPEVLYHWCAAEGSTALTGANKGYAMKAGLRAVADYLEWEQLPARVEPGVAPNTYSVRWSVPEPAPLVSLLVPTRDRVEILKPCVDALLSRTDYPNFELLILDNQSSCPKTLAYLEQVSEDPRVSVHRWDHPFNYSAINNFGARLAKGEILGLINNDIEPINEDWLREMVGQACRPEIGCVGAKLYYPNDTVQHGGVILGIGGVAGHAHKYFHRHDYGYFSRLHLVQNLSAVTAACLLVRKSIFEQVGGLDEENLAVAFNDVDLCLKVREAGYRNLWTPNAELYHHESVSRGADDTQAKRRRAQREAEYMRRRWGHVLDSDPAYNPNLTLIHEDFSLA